MTIFKDHKVTANQLLDVIDDDLLSYLSIETNVDHYAKVLHGKKLFYLLIYGILENDRLSQRTLEETFNDPVFKMLFYLDPSENVRHSSICDRLAKIDPDFFRQIFEQVYAQFSDAYSRVEREKLNLIRVDSSMVSEMSTLLVEGISNNRGKKAVKYSIAFDGLLPCECIAFTEQKYANEDNAMPQVVRNHVKAEDGHHNIYLLDRGLQSSKNMTAFDKESISFIVRAKENRKYVELESLLTKETPLDLGELTLVKDSKVQLYTWVPSSGAGHKHRLCDAAFRLIIVQDKRDSSKQFWFITNEFELSAKAIADAYRRRWDIEVFFRFIKQELNASHLVSLNKNGIEVMLYATMLASILVLIYKRANGIGYKTAKRRFLMEVRNLIISLIVIECGGDPARFFKT